MTLRPEFTLGHSPYNAFLFAEVGEEHAGVSLTGLSALTRLGFDPWQEAARLSDLPRDTAARAFAVTIAMLPEGDWKARESDAIAARLVNWLPAAGSATVPSVEAGRSDDKKIREIAKMKRGSAAAMAWSVLAAALLFFAMHLFSDNNLETGQGAGVSTRQETPGRTPF